MKVITLALLVITAIPLRGHAQASNADVAAEINNPYNYEALVDSADNYIKRERYADAERCIRGALKAKPASPLNYLLFTNLASCLTGQQRYNDAIDAFEIALIQQKETSSILLKRAQTYTLMGNTDKAICDLRESLSLQPHAIPARRLLGQLLLAYATPSDTIKIAEARSHFDFIRHNSPSDAWGHAGTAECLVLQNCQQQAIPYFKKAIELDNQADFYISLISTLMATHQYAEAEDAIIQAIKDHPRYGDLYLARGILHRKLFQNHEAEIDKKLAAEYGTDIQTIEKYLP